LKHSESIISTDFLKSEADSDFALDLEEHETRQFDCGSQVHGLRLDNALVQLVAEFSRSYLQ
jgi:23S rRNA pseudouridine1911/1915/1917 synthase